MRRKSSGLSGRAQAELKDPVLRTVLETGPQVCCYPNITHDHAGNVLGGPRRAGCGGHYTVCGDGLERSSEIDWLRTNHAPWRAMLPIGDPHIGAGFCDLYNARSIINREPSHYPKNTGGKEISAANTTAAIHSTGRLSNQSLIADRAGSSMQLLFSKSRKLGLKASMAD